MNQDRRGKSQVAELMAKRRSEGVPGVEITAVWIDEADSLPYDAIMPDRSEGCRRADWCIFPTEGAEHVG